VLCSFLSGCLCWQPHCAGAVGSVCNPCVLLHQGWMAVTTNVMHWHDSTGAMEFRRDPEEQVSEFLGCRISASTVFFKVRFLWKEALSVPHTNAHNVPCITIFYKLTIFQFCKWVSINMTGFLAHDAVYKGIMVSEIPAAFSVSFKNYTSHIWENQNFNCTSIRVHVLQSKENIVCCAEVITCLIFTVWRKYLNVTQKILQGYDETQ